MTEKHVINNNLSLKNIQGICYSPVPSDDKLSPPPKYFDTDFTNSTFPMIWGSKNGGRSDIKNLANIGVNFVHLYNWSVPPAPGHEPKGYQRSHTTFLKECGDNRINVFVPISNYFLEQIKNGKGLIVKKQISAMVTEAYNEGRSPYGGAAMWGIGNEYDLAGTLFSVKEVVTAIEYLLDAETELGIDSTNVLPVTSPVSFSTQGKPNEPGIVGVQNLKNAIEASPKLGPNFWKNRFVASVNPFNNGTSLKTYVETTFPKAFPDTYFFFAEMGVPIQKGTPVTSEKEQESYVLSQLKHTVPTDKFIGRCVFQFLDQSAMKTGTEATFGMTKYSGNTSAMGTIPLNYVPGGGDSYPIDILTFKLMYKSVKTEFE